MINKKTNLYKLCAAFQKEAVLTNLYLAQDWIDDFKKSKSVNDLDLATWELSKCKKLIKAYQPEKFDIDILDRFNNLRKEILSFQKEAKNKSFEIKI